MTSTAGRDAIIVIDVQQAFFSPAPGPVHAGSVIDRINRLTQRARDRGVAVIFVQHEHKEEGPQFGSVEWQLDPRLRADPQDTRVRKTTPDSFHATNLEQWLRSRDISHVVLCGYATEFCIDTTARRAASLGFGVTIVEDAHTTEDKAHLEADKIIKHHNVTLSDITSFRVHISTQPAASLWTSPSG